MIYIISRLLLFNSAEIANLSQQEKKKKKPAISHQRRLESPQGDARNTLTFTLFFFFFSKSAIYLGGLVTQAR